MSALDAELTARLRERSLRVTSQRLLIHRALRERGGHVTAEEVFELVGPGLPGISQQTVYATLQLLAELGLARRVPAPGGSARFETRLDEHHHTVCEVCGRIEDVDVPVPVGRVVAAAREGGFEPTLATVTVLGRCAACSAG